MAGLGVVGRDRYGVFPLRGKLLNVRDAPATQVSNNEEIQNLKKILGLQHGVVRHTNGASKSNVGTGNSPSIGNHLCTVNERKRHVCSMFKAIIWGAQQEWQLQLLLAEQFVMSVNVSSISAADLPRCCGSSLWACHDHGRPGS